MSITSYPDRGGFGASSALTSVPTENAGATIVVGGTVYVWNGSEYVISGNGSLATDADMRHAISIHDLDMTDGQVLNITSPYSTGDLPSNSLMHPTVIKHSRGVDGSPFVMVVTPFANADDTTENPCIYVSDDLLTWRTPAGVTNPVIAQPPSGYNSDACIYEHTDGYTYMVYRKRINLASNTIYGCRSLDCITWSTPVVLLQAIYSGSYPNDWASPSFWHDGTQWVFFSHDIANTNAIEKMVKSGDLLTSWGAVSPSVVTPTHPNGLSWWHSDIRRLPNGRLIGLVLEGGAAGAPGGGAGGASGAWLWQSDDLGVTWGMRPLTRGKVNYRSSLVIEKSSFKIILVWVDATAAGTPTSTVMALHSFHGGRIERRRTQANIIALSPPYSIVMEDEQLLLTHADGFAGTAADLTTPWTQVTASPMRRNGSGVAVSTNTSTAAAVVSVGYPDHYARVKFTAYAAGQAYLILKYINATNYLAIGIAAADGKLAVKGIVAGVAVLDEAFLLTPSLAVGQIVRAIVDGLRLRIWVDGVEAQQYTIPVELAPGVSCGIYSSGSASNQLDEFMCGKL